MMRARRWWGAAGGAGPDAVGPGAMRRTLRRIVGFFRPYRGRLAVIAVSILVTVSIGVVNPILLKLVIDNLTRAQRPRAALSPVGLMIVLPIVTSLIGVGQSLPLERVGQRVMNDLRAGALPPPAVDAAAVLHRDAHRRDPEPHRQRRRRGADRW